MIELREDHSVFSWFKQGDLTIRGYVWNESGEYLTGSALNSYFLEKIDEVGIDQTLIQANGCFALIWKNDEITIAAVDKTRTFPLLYTHLDNRIAVGDNASFFYEKSTKKEWDNTSIHEFKMCFYTTGKHTLIKGFYQIQAGEYILISGQKIQTVAYYNHLHDRIEKNEKELEQEFLKVTRSLEEKLLTSLQDKTVVIPLSGGYDSRYILAMLLKNNFKNIICYTYGRKDSFEVETASKICYQKNIPWHFIEFSDDLFETYFSKDATAYLKSSHYLSSLPYEQEFLALNYLQKRKLIPSDAVIIPGFCGDLLAGSYHPLKAELSNIMLNHQNLAFFILKKHFKTYEKGYEKEILSRILTEILPFKITSLDDWISVHENWFTNHKVSRYVINGLRSFEYYGFEWRMPLWERNFVEFWYHVSNQFRIDKKFYEQMLHKHYFGPLNISIKIKRFDDNYRHDSVWFYVKKYIPRFIRTLFKTVLIQEKNRDINRFSVLHKMIKKKLKDKRGINSEMDVNYLESRYFLENFQQFI